MAVAAGGANQLGTNNYTQGGWDYQVNPSTSNKYQRSTQVSPNTYSNLNTYWNNMLKSDKTAPGGLSDMLPNVSSTSSSNPILNGSAFENPYLGGGPGAPSINAPSQAKINSDFNTTLNNLIAKSNPSQNQATGAINQGIAQNKAQQQQNTQLGQQGIQTEENLNTKYSNYLTNLAHSLEAQGTSGQLASQAGTENLMKEGQQANIGGVTAAAGRSGFTSGIGQGDPFVQAQVNAMNQPYFQQLQNVNAQTQNNLAQMTVNIYNQLGGNIASLDNTTMTAIQSIINNTMNNNTALSQTITNADEAKAQIIYNYYKGNLTQAQALTALNIQNKEQYKALQVTAYQAAVQLQGSRIQGYNSAMSNEITQEGIAPTTINAESNLIGSLGGNVYVKNNGLGSQTLIDKTTGKVIGNISVPQNISNAAGG